MKTVQVHKWRRGFVAGRVWREAWRRRKREYLEAELFRSSVIQYSVFHSARPTNWDQSMKGSHTPRSSIQMKALPIIAVLAYDLMDSRCTNNATELYSSSMCICFRGFSEASIQEEQRFSGQSPACVQNICARLGAQIKHAYEPGWRPQDNSKDT